MLKEQFGDFEIIEAFGLDMNIVGLIFSLIHDYQGELMEHKTIRSLEDFMSSPRQPVVPPYLYLESAFLKLNLDKIRKLKFGNPPELKSIDPLVDFEASQ